MTLISAPGAAAIPPAATPRAQGPPEAAGVPRPMRGSYGNLGAAVRVAPSPTPRAQAPGIPIARPRVPLAPHKQGGPAPGAPRPMVNHGGAPMSAATPTPRMQAPPQPGRAPAIPPNTCGVGATVPSARPHTPLVQPTQRTPAVTAPSLGKREPTTMGPAPIQQAKRHAPMPRPQGAPTGGAPLPTNVRAPVPPGHAPTAGNTTPPRPPSPPQLPMFGVYQDPSKGWMARVVDPKRRVARDIGPFDTVHLAALAHDRVAVAYAGRGMGPRARLNFETAFYAVETAFLQRWEGDVCEAVEKGDYEKTCAKFLKAGYRAALNVKPGGGGGEQIADGDEGDELIASCYDAELFWETIEDFFLNRPVEIGAMALGEGGELLRNRFVEMHRNKSLCPVWRRDDRMEKLKTMALQKQQQQQIQMLQQQQQQQHTQMQMQQQQQQQQQQQIQMQPQQHHQQQIQMQRQQEVQQQQMMIQKQRQQQMMMAQQQQHYPDDDATLQVKHEL